ncbi:MAG: efflux RND transporter periplasmic adaptor subunit [bacterium]|nr:efflux RND transporter periplasmic adaptor subunit [bacterium]
MKLISQFSLTASLLASTVLNLPECRAEDTLNTWFGARFKEGRGVEVSSETKQILGLEIVEVTEEQQGSRNILVVPASSLLKTITGTYIYVVNGKHFLRTQVTTDKIDKLTARITDGLFSGDEVVTKSVNSLWYVELQALRGGKACTDGH